MAEQANVAGTRIARPAFTDDPALGIVHAEHFQVAYATNDIERACAVLADRYGIRQFRRLEGELPEGGRIRVELAWVGPLMYELMSAHGPGSDVYVGRLPVGGFAMRHHHLGYLVHGQRAWDALLTQVERDGWDMPIRRTTPGFLSSCMIDAPELGHYLEYIFPEEAGLRFLEDVPRN